VVSVRAFQGLSECALYRLRETNHVIVWFETFNKLKGIVLRTSHSQPGGRGGFTPYNGLYREATYLFQASDINRDSTS